MIYIILSRCRRLQQQQNSKKTTKNFFFSLSHSHVVSLSLSLSLSLYNFPGKVNSKRKINFDLGFFIFYFYFFGVNNVSDREIDAESGSTEHKNAQPHCAPKNRSLHRRDLNHRRSRHLLRVQHREQPMGSFLYISLFQLLFGCRENVGNFNNFQDFFLLFDF